MTTSSKRPKRPADVVGNPIRVAQIATGEVEEEYEREPEKNAAAAELAAWAGESELSP